MMVHSNNLTMMVHFNNGVPFHDERGSFWVVFEGRQPDIYNSWPKAKYQINCVSGNCHKKSLSLYEGC